MRWMLSILIVSLVFGACAAPGTTSPSPEPNAAQKAAEEAFVELEGGGAMPLPGLAPISGEEVTISAVALDDLSGAVRRAETVDYQVQAGWFLIDTTMLYPATTAPEQARSRTLQVARTAGLERSLPQEVSFVSLLTDVMDETAGSAYEKSTWSTFAFSAVAGLIVDEKILSAEIVPGERNLFGYRVVLEARVLPVKGDRDPSVSLELDVENRLLETGDELIVRAKSSTSGYLYLFDFLADNSVTLLYPNRIMSENLIQPDQWFEIPSRSERDRGIKFRVAADPHLATTIETVYGVFSRRKVADLAGLISASEGYVSFSSGDKSFTQFQRWLWEIPLNERVERAVQLHIVNTKE